MTFISLLSYSCPLILCSLGALFTEYAGCLALFLDGLVSFSAFLFYALTVGTGSALAGAILACLPFQVDQASFKELPSVSEQFNDSPDRTVTGAHLQ